MVYEKTAKVKKLSVCICAVLFLNMQGKKLSGIHRNALIVLTSVMFGIKAETIHFGSVYGQPCFSALWKCYL